MSDPKDWTRNAAAGAKREEREALESAVSALDGEDNPKQPTADEETAPRPTSNADKHEVATRLLHTGARGDHPDPDQESAGNLPDRIRDRC